MHLLPSVTEYADVMVDALGMVESFTVPLQVVEVSEVEGMLPDEERTTDFVPSELWLIVSVASTAFTQAFSVIFKDSVALVALPAIDMVNVPVPDVIKPVLFRL